MPEIKGVDRQELTHPNILKCSDWKDLSNAQKAFLQGVNLPDAGAFMGPSHNVAPMEILAAMYILKDICPPYFMDRSEETKTFICRMQRYMTWGAKLHIEMDKITHAKLPYAYNQMYKHVWIECTWDERLCNEILVKIDSKTDQLKRIVKSGGRIFALQSADFDDPDSHKLNDLNIINKVKIFLNGLDIRDKFIDFILSFYDNGDVKVFRKILDGTEATMGIQDFNLKKPIPREYSYPNLTDKMINLVNHINLTKGPTQQDINEQYDIDLPEEMKKVPIRRGSCIPGKKMLDKVRELSMVLDKLEELYK